MDDSFILTDDDTSESVLAQSRQAWTNADEIAAASLLDDLAMRNRRGPMSLRWIYAHMIEELARHAGHGDTLRKQILAAGGQKPELLPRTAPSTYARRRLSSDRYVASRSLTATG